ncbi:MAG: DUF1490 family protein [Peptococcaceae bacterium]|nr:DUF1490 family protein [Peptococcaceae bacterium]
MNCLECIKNNAKVVCYVGGIVTACVVKKVVKSNKFRETCVSTLATGMKMQREAEACVQNIKDEAQDLCYDAAIAANVSEEA